MCSQVYSIGVTASKDNCSSNESAAVTLKTGKALKELKTFFCQCFESQQKNICVFIQHPALHLSSTSQ